MLCEAGPQPTPETKEGIGIFVVVVVDPLNPCNAAMA